MTVTLTVTGTNTGEPSHGIFGRMLLGHSSPEEMLETIRSPAFSTYDQWQVQLFALICSAHLKPVADMTVAISEELKNIGWDAPVAVLPERPMTVPYLEHAPIRA